ncbi:HNH endonuclease [Kitasatospora sp. NPDC085879]|uniref:HNH endonuclease n=1 Tax=Kitasatospora sp. NPDC085879 TaxID=3154769 RepID=UPI00341EFF0C
MDAQSAAQKPKSDPDWAWDELVLVCDLVARNGWKQIHAREGDPRVEQMVGLLHALPIHPPHVRGPKFRNRNGVGRKMLDFETARDPDRKATKGGVGVLKVLEAFEQRPDEMAAYADRLRDAALSGVLDDLPPVDDPQSGGYSAIEGRVLLQLHLRRERNQKLRREKIRQVTARGGALACEACGFDFARVYGDRGAGYIECHHIVPLHQAGEGRVRLDDLALICSNCHRMIHRQAPWLTPPQLKDLIWAQSEAVLTVSAVEFTGHGDAVAR